MICLSHYFKRKQSGSMGNWLSTYKKSTTILSKKEKSWPHKSTCSNLVKSLSFLSIVSISNGIIISMRLHSTTFQWTQLGVMILKRHIQRRKKLFISFFLRAHLINPLTCVYHFYALSFSSTAIMASEKKWKNLKCEEGKV